MVSSREVIVMGGSLAGFLAARVLSDHFEKVTIIERDAVHDRPEEWSVSPRRSDSPEQSQRDALGTRGL